MISSHESLTVARKQLALVEDVVIGLHKQLWDKNRRNYYLYADGAIDTMLKLRAEIDEFLGIIARPQDDESLNGAAATEAPAGEAAKP